MKYKEESKKSVKTIESFFDERTVQEGKLNLKVRNVLYGVINDLEDVRIEEAEKTPKVSTERLDLQIPDLINNSLNGYI